MHAYERSIHLAPFFFFFFFFRFFRIDSLLCMSFSPLHIFFFSNAFPGPFFFVKCVCGYVILGLLFGLLIHVFVVHV